MPLLLILIFLFPGAGATDSQSDASSPLVRVAILEGAKQVTLDAAESLLVKDKTSPSWGWVTSGPLYIKAGDGKLLLGGREYRSLQVTPPEGVKILVNNKAYWGHVELHPQGKDSLLAINVIELEEYLPGVLREEASPKWPPEFLLAQAVIARTFALNVRRDNEGQLFHLKATVASQVYGGAGREDPRLAQAVSQTRGQVLYYQGEIIPAFYHATCGGRTEDANLIWPKAPGYMKGVECGYCQASPHYTWKADLPLEQIRKSLSQNGVSLGNINGWRVLETSPSGRVTKLSIDNSQGQYILEGEKLRRFVGYDVIKSANFTVHNGKGKAHFAGRGWGHGAGLCQWGAKNMADKGFKYQQILRHYFPYAELVRSYW